MFLLVSFILLECVDLISKLLNYNANDRFSAKQALNHIYFKELVEFDNKKNLMNNFKYLNQKAFLHLK